MKRLLKVFAFLGGLGALGWLMRNRVVSVTMNREPQTPEPAPEPTVDQQASSDLVTIDGLSDAHAAQLSTAGVATISQLAEADLPALSKATGIPEEQIAAWIKSAEALVG